MNTLGNDRITLTLGPDGALRLEDRRRGQVWRMPAGASTFRRTGDQETDNPLPPGDVQGVEDGFRMSHHLPEGVVRIRWTLATDHIGVTLETAPASVCRLDLPGTFRPEHGAAALLLPLYQGLLYRPQGDSWEDEKPGGAHGNFSLSMGGMLGERGGLLVVQETVADWRCRFGEDAAGTHLRFIQERCPIEGWTRRDVRLYPVDADVAAVAKRYRARLRERDEFVGWDEKIARKPILENLFGALMAFTGYNRAAGVDYAENAQRIRDLGFERVLYFPVRMCNYSLGFLMGGDAPIWLDDAEIARIKAVPGALVGPWGWFLEGLDDGSERMRRLYRHSPAGKPYNGWRIEDQQWKVVCTPYQVEEIHRRFADDMQAMDWIHYDVNATRLGREICHRADHDLHGGTPLTRSADVDWTRRLLGPDTNGNRIVSSEGFVDRYAPAYDIGTVKIMPNFSHDTPFIPLPLTMLVLHDSCVHDWWELHNYNETPGWPAKVSSRYGMTGSGLTAKKAAMDALYGCPPNVFPFGRQYAWVDVGTRRTFSYQIALGDREVQRALAAALPVANLHRRIGRLEMTGFELLGEDGSVQATSFADGTRIVANIGNLDRHLDGLGTFPANSWRALS